MRICPACRRSQPEINRFCTSCGRRLDEEAVGGLSSSPDRPKPGQLNVQVLYGMVAVLIFALLFPPWETPPEQPPQFLGLHFILSPPVPDAVVSRMLLTIELITIAMAGFYGAFLFRQK